MSQFPSADADANTARAGSLKGGNQELIAANRIVESLPSLVGAAADGIAESNLTIFNGAEGVNQVITGLVGQGLSVLDTLKRSTAAGRKDTEPVLRAQAVEPALTAAAEPVPEANAAAEPAPEETVAEPVLEATAAGPAPEAATAARETGTAKPAPRAAAAAVPGGNSSSAAAPATQS